MAPATPLFFISFTHPPAVHPCPQAPPHRCFPAAPADEPFTFHLIYIPAYEKDLPAATPPPDPPGVGTKRETQHHSSRGRRPGIWRPFVLRCHPHPDSHGRQSGAPRRAIHQYARLRLHLHPFTLRPAHRAVSLPQNRDGRGGRQCRHDHPTGTDHRGRPHAPGGIRHRSHRQMAPGTGQPNSRTRLERTAGLHATRPGF